MPVLFLEVAAAREEPGAALAAATLSSRGVTTSWRPLAHDTVLATRARVPAATVLDLEFRILRRAHRHALHHQPTCMSEQ